MKGLEPSTFCMARRKRELTGDDSNRQLAQGSGFWESRDDMGCQQPTAKASHKASQEATGYGPVRGIPALRAIRSAQLFRAAEPAVLSRLSEARSTIPVFGEAGVVHGGVAGSSAP